MDFECTPYAAELFMMESAYDTCIQVPITSSIYGISFEVKLENLATTIRFNIPLDFPEKSITFSISGKFNNMKQTQLMKQLLDFIHETPDAGCMLICEVLNDGLNDIIEQEQINAQSNPSNSNSNSNIDTNLSIARFLIYFHHIMR